MENIDNTVDNLETSISVAQVVRDVSFDALMVGAVVISGGTGLAIAGGGSVLKGVATYQDTGNIGAAAIETTGSFILAAIPISAAGNLSTSGKVVLVFLDANFEISKSLISGDSVKQSLAKGGTKLVISGGAEALGSSLNSEPVQEMLSKTAVVVEKSSVKSAAELADTQILDEFGQSMTIQLGTYASGKVAGVVIDQQFSLQDKLAIRKSLAKLTSTCIGDDEMCADMRILDLAIQPIQSIEDFEEQKDAEFDLQ